jgi:hypothetical protein
MAEAGGFRWTTLRIAALYPFALIPILTRTIITDASGYYHPARFRAPGGAALVGVLAAGACALAITRTFNFDWPAWAIALAAYLAGGVAAAVIFGYVQLLRSELKQR